MFHLPWVKVFLQRGSLLTLVCLSDITMKMALGYFSGKNTREQDTLGVCVCLMVCVCVFGCGCGCVCESVFPR